MDTPAYIALSRQTAIRQKMDVLANNLANLNTPGFKAESLLFTEYLQAAPDSQDLSYVQSTAMVRDFSPGPLLSTGNPLDLALPGDGYFAVETPDGTRYTRQGSFALNADGEIVTPAGHRLLGEGDAPITIPPNSGRLTVAPDGTVSGRTGSLGRIAVVVFDDEAGLRKIGGGLLDAGGQPARPTLDPELHQGMIEGSNVQGVLEMTRMIETVRHYQAASKLVDEEHRRQRKAIEGLVPSNG